MGVAAWHGESTILHVYSRKLSTHIHLATIQSLSSFYGPGGGYNLCHKVVAFSYLPPGTTATHTKKKKFDGSESNEPSHADHGIPPSRTEESVGRE